MNVTFFQFFIDKDQKKIDFNSKICWCFKGPNGLFLHRNIYFKNFLMNYNFFFYDNKIHPMAPSFQKNLAVFPIYK